MSDQDNNSNDSQIDEQLEGEELETEAAEGTEGSEQPPKQTEAQAKAIEKAIKEFELTVNGKAKKVSLDLNDEKAIKKYLEKAEGAQSKFEEAAQYRKQAEQLVTMLKENPLAILRNPALGIDVKKLAEMVLDEQLEEATLTPEQKEIRDLKKSLKEREDKEKADKEKTESEEKARLAKEMREKTEQDMITALDKSEIGASPYAVRRVADIMSALIHEGYEDVTIEKIMPFAEDMIMKEFGSHVQKHRDPVKLEKLLGKDVLGDYRKSKLSNVKKTPSAKTVETGKNTGDDKPKEPVKKIKMSDWGNPWS